MAKELVHKINDAADAIADATAMVWAVFYIVQGMSQDNEADALTACCNQALQRLAGGAEILEGFAAHERKREGC